MENLIQYLSILTISTLRYFVLAGIPFLLFYKFFLSENLKSKIQNRFATDKDFKREIKHSIRSTFIFSGIGFLFLFTPIRQYTHIYENIADYSAWWIPVSLLLAIILNDSYFYWMHRIMHHPTLYKHTHLIHHKSINPSPWASYSFNVIEAVVEVLILPIILFIIPFHPLSIFLFTIISFLINVYGHLGFEIAPKWFRHSFLFQILNTSVYHNLHHSKFNGNYSLYFRFWDRLMGTEHPDYIKLYDQIQEKRFGISKNSTNQLHSTIVTCILIVISISCFGQSIEGNWKDSKTGAIVNIYKEKNAYFGKVVSSGNDLDDKKITDKKIFVLTDFQKEKEKLYCCGSIYLPRRKIYAKGKLNLVNPNKLKVKGYYGFLSHSMIWRRLG